MTATSSLALTSAIPVPSDAYREDAPSRDAGPSYLGIAWEVGRLRIGRDDEGEGGSRACVRGSPEASAMALDDRAAHRETDPHPVGLGGIERLEQPLGLSRSESHADIPHREAYATVLPSGAHHHQPR